MDACGAYALQQMIGCRMHVMILDLQDKLQLQMRAEAVHEKPGSAKLLQMRTDLAEVLNCLSKLPLHKVEGHWCLVFSVP